LRESFNVQQNRNGFNIGTEMDLISDRVLSQLKERAYDGCKRNIQNNLSRNEKLILEKVKLLMGQIKIKNIHVFCYGKYVSFLEGIRKNYNSICLVYTCQSKDWNEVLDPLTYLEIFMTPIGECSLLREETRSLKNGERLEGEKCKLKFVDGTEFIINLVKVSIYQTDLKTNLVELFSRVKSKTCKIALPYNWDEIFRWTLPESADNLNYFGTPFSLSWYCAKKIKLI